LLPDEYSLGQGNSGFFPARVVTAFTTVRATVRTVEPDEITNVVEHHLDIQRGTAVNTNRAHVFDALIFQNHKKHLPSKQKWRSVLKTERLWLLEFIGLRKLKRWDETEKAVALSAG
jgi:hypothetical protein